MGTIQIKPPIQICSHHFHTANRLYPTPPEMAIIHPAEHREGRTTTTSRTKQRLVDYNSGNQLVGIKKVITKKRFLAIAS